MSYKMKQNILNRTCKNIVNSTFSENLGGGMVPLIIEFFFTICILMTIYEGRNGISLCHRL